MGERSSHSLRIHLGLFFAEAICVSAFVIEMSRALSGNTLSWAYVVEWPILGSYAVYMWRKLLADEATPTSTSSCDNDEDPSDHYEDDAPLRAWNAYLSEVHRHDQSDPSHHSP